MPRDQLLAMMRDRQVPFDSLVWTPGMTHWQSASAFAEFAQAMGVPHRARSISPTDSSDDAVAAIIPFANPQALIAYYLAIASLIPIAGAILGPLAIRAALRALRFRREHRIERGVAHAFVALALGSVATLLHIALVVLVVLAAIGIVQIPALN